MKHPSFPRRARGFTLVELMVGVLIGLIGTVVIFQVFAVSEGQKRTTTGASDAQQNGVFSLFQIERDLRMAGFGLNYTPLLGCQTNGWNESTGQTISFPLLPVQITNGAGIVPDTITIAYADADLFAAPQKLTIPMASATSNFRIRDRWGIRPGDVLIAAQAGSPCTLAQASNYTVGLYALDVPHLSGTFTNPYSQVYPSRFNKPGGLAAPNNIAYTAWSDSTGTGGRLFNLGQNPTVVRYSIVNSQLVADDLLTPQAGGTFARVVLADGVVQLQAQYGFDASGNGQMASTALSVPVINTAAGQPDQWGYAMPAGAVAADWQRVIAVRLFVVARSMTPERKDAGGNCVTTTVAPRWIAPAPPAGVAVDVSAWNPAEWGCYRYRSFEVVVPIRNMMWFPQPS
jgi:type IV pilus assembly protein PilW